MLNPQEFGIRIISGRYEDATPQQQEMVAGILGGDTQNKFDLYFHWYNILHELGHGITCFNMEERLPPMEEELLVNEFAVAYWDACGEAGRLEALERIVEGCIARLRNPAPPGMDYMTYAAEMFGKEEFYTFNNYGWFQFSCVRDCLVRRKPLREVLRAMTGRDIQTPVSRRFAYRIEGNMAEAVASDAAALLREWGIALPDVCVVYDSDPNRQMCDVYQV